MCDRGAVYLIITTRNQVVISTGKSDWEHSVTSERGSLASHLSIIEKAAPLTIAGDSTPGTASVPGTPGTPTSRFPSAVAGIFKDSETHTVAILNGSHDTLSKDNDHETVLVFPDYKVVTEVPRSLDGARELWRNSVNPCVPRMGSSSEASTIKSWVIPYTCVILICERPLYHRRTAHVYVFAICVYVCVCALSFPTERWCLFLRFLGSHRRRDVRCAVAAPKLEHGSSFFLFRLSMRNFF